MRRGLLGESRTEPAAAVRGPRIALTQGMSLESILVPIDGSSPSLAALEHALVLAEDTGATVDVLHVAIDDELTTSESTGADVDAAVARAVDRLGRPRVNRLESAGDPQTVIIETARAGGYDMIVLGTHGRIGRLHELLGSVAEGVVRNAPCPVLTVRDVGGGYQSFAERRHGRPSISEQATHR